ncbi:cytosolic 5'-nucleotidase III-like protein [Reticulomyxa filosa]|uniref:5'-nucleotidase n=1 Tax=Reticulomyxa filosa TaxID=46433 RepID=X6N621_RETFI|nr:cytosolic 5'-nucleotidase III-like protein [Reticulomyxa filosa]|eukprot:ETO21740.1 cytosolic 5'-nucleotidase III-like protein [Reticulomyxa filosa]
MGPLVHGYNKHEIYTLCENYFHSHEEMNGRCFALCLGDSITDCDVMKNIPHIRECIYVGFLTKNIDAQLHNYLQAFDVVIVQQNASMEFVLDLLRFLLEDSSNKSSFSDKWINKTK